MSDIVCRLPARLHFGLLDMNGSLGRVDGGIGLAIQEPATVLVADHAAAVAVQGIRDPSLRERLETGLRTVCECLELPGVSLSVRQSPSAHSGFGSATQILVGAARTVSLLAQNPRPALTLARMMGRGGTSGIGTAAIEGGGFILDGGHAFRTGPGSKQAYMPSRAAQDSCPPPVLVQVPFPPEWQILICVPPGLDIDGKRELEIFAQECPVPDSEVDRMCRIALMQMLPAIAERDLARFCHSMEAYQALGFKQAEVRTQTAMVHSAMAHMRDIGGQGVGMSSWGPAIFAFGTDLEALKANMQKWLLDQGGGDIFITQADNVGHRMLL